MGKSLESALGALSRRALTVSELRQRLERKGFGRADIEETLTRLSEWGYLDDQRLAMAYAKNRCARYSRQRIRVDLLRRGVERSLAEEAVRGISEEEELRQCLLAAEKLVSQEGRRAQTGKPGWVSARQRVGAKLLKQGYQRDMVLMVLDNFYKSD